MVRVYSMTSHYDYPLTSYGLCPSCFPSWCQRNLPKAVNTPAISRIQLWISDGHQKYEYELLKLFPKLFLEFFLQCTRQSTRVRVVRTATIGNVRQLKGLCSDFEKFTFQRTTANGADSAKSSRTPLKHCLLDTL